MPRAQTVNAETSINLDPFIDIVTNVIGALFFMILFVALAALDVRRLVVTPLVSEGNTEPVVFVCNENRIFYPDMEGLRDEFLEKLSQPSGDSVADFLSSGDLDNLSVENDAYKLWVGADSEGEPLVVYERLPGARGDSPGQLAEDMDARFVQTLRSLDSETQHVFLIVDADSFEVFQAARGKALQAGFSVGWEPYGGGALVPSESGDINTGWTQTKN